MSEFTDQFSSVAETDWCTLVDIGVGQGRLDR